MCDDLEQKRNHTFYVTNEASAMTDELAQAWGISRAAVFEYSIRAVYNSRSALTYAVAKERAEQRLKDPNEVSPYDSTE